jgi:hypothetical protein
VTEVAHEAFERLKTEFDRRCVDAKAIQDLVECGIECRRLDAVVANEDEAPEVRLAAAMRGLDLAGITARAAKPYECDPSELSLPELYVAMVRIEAGFA